MTQSEETAGARRLWGAGSGRRGIRRMSSPQKRLRSLRRPSHRCLRGSQDDRLRKSRATGTRRYAAETTTMRQVHAGRDCDYSGHGSRCVLCSADGGVSIAIKSACPSSPPPPGQRARSAAHKTETHRHFSGTAFLDRGRAHLTVRSRHLHELHLLRCNIITSSAMSRGDDFDARLQDIERSKQQRHVLFASRT